MNVRSDFEANPSNNYNISRKITNANLMVRKHESGSPKSGAFILMGPWKSMQNVLEIH